MKQALAVLLGILHFFLGQAETGQSMYARDMKAMQQKMGKEAKFSAQMVITNKNVKGFIPVINATIHKQGEEVYYKVLHLEYLFGGQYSVIVNHKSRSMAYSEKEEGSGIKPLTPDMDSVLSMYDSVVYAGVVENSRKYYVYNNRGLIKVSEVYFDPAKEFIAKLVYHYNPVLLGEEATIVIEYKDVMFSPLFGEKEFSESRFITKKGDKWIPAHPWEGYLVMKAKTDFGEY